MNLDFKRILCPVDMSEFSLDALRLAVKLAECSDATLDILHVIHNPFDELYMTAIAETDPALIDAYAWNRKSGQKFCVRPKSTRRFYSNSSATIAVKHHSKVRYHVRNGDPFELILDGAQDFLTDLIVLATHGRTGIKRLVIGNVAEKVVRHAPCPVLTVKAKARCQVITRPEGR